MSKESLARVWPEWEIEKVLGQGSFGVVYQAVRRDSNVESRAAIKIISIPANKSEIESLRAEGLDDQGTKTYFKGVVDDFVSEIQLMETLKGIQNIVSVEDYKVVEKQGEIGWEIFIRMELLTPFNVYLDGKKMSEKEVAKLGADICAALEICDKRKIIHRDIKPENIFINDFGHFKLGDFGIARKLENVTGGLSQKGTYFYMAPDVANGTNYDARADLYSLGIVLYRLLNGNMMPFIENEKQLLDPNMRKQAVDRRLRGETLPAPSDASSKMAALILKACAFNPKNRFANATEMKNALLGIISGNDAVGGVVAGGTGKKFGEETVVVRKGKKEEQNVQKASDDNGKKKKSPLPIIIIVVILLIAALGVAAYFLLFKGDGGDDESTEDGSSVVSVNDSASANNGSSTLPEISATDDEAAQIARYIELAEEKAAEKKYDEAIDIIEIALESYPESDALHQKIAEYNAAIVDEQISVVIAQAEEAANEGDYTAALGVIENALSSYPENQRLLEKKDEYMSKLNEKAIAEALAQAEALANVSDYEMAIKVLEQAKETYGTNDELEAKLVEYKAKIDNPGPEPIIDGEEKDITAGADVASATLLRREDINHVSFTTADNYDYFRVRTSSNDSLYRFYIKNNSIDSTLYLRVVNERQEELGEASCGKGEEGYVDLRLDKSTTYYIGVGRRYGDRMGNYIVSVNEKLCDAGINKDTSFEISRDTEYVKNFNVKGFDDWYIVNASDEYAVLRFKLDNISIDSRTYITVYDKYDAELGSTSGNKGESAYFTIKPSAGDVYYIRISRYYNDRLGNYKLSVLEEVCDAGLSKDEAFEVSVNQEYIKEFDNNKYDDYFEFTVDADGKYDIYFENLSVNCRIYLNVYDQYDAHLGELNRENNSSILGTFAFEAGKTYYMRVDRYYDDRLGNYKFKISPHVEG